MSAFTNTTCGGFPQRLAGGLGNHAPILTSRVAASAEGHDRQSEKPAPLNPFARCGVASSGNSRKQTPAVWFRRIFWAAGVAILPTPARAAFSAHPGAYTAALVGMAVFIVACIIATFWSDQ